MLHFHYIQEVNMPRHKVRYSDLPSVDVSNESFQKLVFKPRKDAKKKEDKKAPGGREMSEGPSIMDLYPTEIVVIFTVLSKHPITFYHICHFYTLNGAIGGITLLCFFTNYIAHSLCKEH